jgi:hypothetical protein
VNAHVDPFSPEELAKVSPITPAAKNLASALARAQAAFKPITRDKTVKVRTKAGGEYSFSYAPLEAILRAVTPALAKEGLALTQSIIVHEGAEYLETTLHLGAESISNRVKVLVGDTGPQAYGSALTYARRYSITLLLCVCADDDDDANAAEGNQATVIEALRKQAQDYARRFNEAFELGLDQAVLDLCEELKGHQELHQATWGYLPSGMRRQVKELLERAKS